MMRALPRLLVGVAAACLVWGPMPAGADGGPGARAVREARRNLAQYDLAGTRTTRIIATLGRAVSTLEHPPDGREARFLRAMAAGDLLIIASRMDDMGLRRRVARAWGAPPGRVAAEVARELEALQVGVYAAAATDALEALAHLRARRAGAEVSWAHPGGLRTQALFTGAVRRALAQADDPVGVLATMGEDPCAAEGATDCDTHLERFDGTGRRAIGTLRAAWRALDGLASAGRQGDPFPAALRQVLQGDGQALAEAVLSPGPRLGDATGLVAAPEGVAPLTADMVLVVRAGEVRFGCVPRVKLGAEGGLTLLTAGQPVLPAVTRLPIPRTFRPAVQPIDALTEALTPNGGLRVAVAAAGDVPAHVVARVIRSASQAGLHPVMLVGPGPDGSLGGARIRIRDGRDGSLGSPEVSVLVRMGGYTVRTPRGKTDVPRVRAAGSLRFDVDGLGAHLGDGAPRSAAVEFMTVASMGPVVQAVFRVAPAAGPVQLLIP